MDFSEPFVPFASDEFPVCSNELPEPVCGYLKRLHAAVSPFRPEYRMALLAFSAGSPAALELLENAPALLLMLIHAHLFRNPTPYVVWAQAHRMLKNKRSQILEWLGWPAEPRVARIVAKVHARDLKVNDLLQLRELCRNGTAMKDLGHLPVIMPEAIRIIAEPELRAKVTFPLLGNLSGMKTCWPVSRMLAEALELALRQEKPLPRFKTVEKLIDTYDELVLREHPSKWNPVYAGHVLPDPFSHLGRRAPENDVEIDWFRTAEELYAWACEEHNCASDLIDDIFAAHILLFKVLRPVRGTLALTEHPANGWQITRFLSARNKPVSKEAVYQVAGYLNRCLLGPDEADDDGIPW